MTGRIRIELLAKSHDRSRFSCGNTRIDDYVRHAVSQDVKRRYAACYVAVMASDPQIAGFYTLSAGHVPLLDVPADLSRKLPRYPSVPVVLIGWLARDVSCAGQGIGALLLVDAIRRIAKLPIGAHAVTADAIDAAAAAFYAGFGFMELPSRPGTFYLPLATARIALDQGSAP